MPDYGFSLAPFFSYKDKIVDSEDRIVDSVLIRENTGQRKPIFWHILCSVQCFPIFWSKYCKLLESIEIDGNMGTKWVTKTV